MARPQKAPEDRRTKQIKFVLNPVEYARIQNRADSVQTTVTDFVRTAALEKPLKVQKSVAPDFMTRNDLRRIGNNLNQSLVEFRMKKIPPPDDLLSAISKLDTLFDKWLDHEPASIKNRP